MALGNYSEDCDYLRNRFNLPETVNLYEMVNCVTNFIKTIDNKSEIEKLKQTVSENAEPISKERKRGRPKKRPNSN